MTNECFVVVVGVASLALDIVAPVADAHLCIENGARGAEETVLPVVGAQMPHLTTSLGVRKEARNKVAPLVGALKVGLRYGAHGGGYSTSGHLGGQLAWGQVAIARVAARRILRIECGNVGI